MTSLNYDITNKLKRLTAFEKIIAINVVVYVVGWVLSIVNTIPRDLSLNWLSLSSSILDLTTKPWSILTYGFSHTDFWHLFFNMLVLYFVGRTFSNLFNVKISLNVYFLGLLFGGALFLLFYTVLPKSFLNNAGGLIGASAGVRAALIFLCTYMPNKEVGFFSIQFRLIYLGLIIVVLDLVGLFGDNRGGNVAHIGGAILGAFYAYQLKNGNDIGVKFGDGIEAIFNKFFGNKKSPLKTVYKSKNKNYAGHDTCSFNEFNKQKQIDIILDKISKSGYESLNSDEKEFLFKAGKNN